jgi:UDP:flavonoid glycosyltransferase YjiC (YdhE family)
LAAFAPEPNNLIVTRGHGRDLNAFAVQPPQMHRKRSLPQRIRIPRGGLVITHGGSGTVRTAHAHGLSMVIIPISGTPDSTAMRSKHCRVRSVPSHCSNSSRGNGNL